MFNLTQYIVVRRDLDMRDIMPQACHAAGKASFWYGFKMGIKAADTVAVNVTPDWGHPTRVIKGARNEKKLHALHEKLTKLGIEHLTVTEPDHENIKGQMTSLALLPGDKEKLAPLLNDFQNLRWEDVPDLERLFKEWKARDELINGNET